MERPTKPCHICGSSDWWQRPASQWGPSEWLCNRCHPDPSPGSDSPQENKQDAEKMESLKENYGSEALILRDRVKRGNDKLTNAWPKIWDIQDEQERLRELERWDRANGLLDTLCMELMYRFNYQDCLYLNGNGHKTQSCTRADGFCCFVCPSKIPYWRKEAEAKE